MFGGLTKHSVVAYIDHDPAADDYLPIWVAPQRCTIIGARVTTANDVAADGTNFFDIALCNGGTAGTGTDAIAGAVGGTAGWVGLTPVAFTIENGVVEAGELVTAHYNEGGTGTFGAMAIQIDYVIGQG